jgi:serine/threonine protein kinase
MGVEMIKDRQGRDHLVMSDEDFYNDDIMGDTLGDYDILQLLANKKDTGVCVSKVKSKFNSKIYVMKCYNSNYNIKEEFEQLKKLDESNITKYFKYFYQNNKLYIIYEYINNTDLQGFLKAYKSLEKPIEIKSLWNIFMQCMSGLKYIHSKNIIHKNISLTNIFMTENKIIKLGDFRFSFIANDPKATLEPADYKSPEFQRNNCKYNTKTDIYAMGVVFKELCSISSDYPKEMMNIIDLMLKREEERPTADYLYGLIMEEYIKNVAKLTSINSVFRCMFSFINFTRTMDEKKQIYRDEAKTPVSFNYIKCIEKYRINGNLRDVAIYLNNFRNLFYQNSQINNDMELKPSLALEFLLEKLNKETGTNFNGPSFKIQPINFNQSKEQSYNEFIQYYNNNFNSIITQYFIGFIKTKRICKTCREGLYSFNLFPFIEFDLDRCGQDLFLANWFQTQNNHCFNLSLEHNVICQQCKGVREHNEFKQFYFMPQNFIISLNRGEGFRNRSYVNYPIQLNLSGKIEKTDSCSIFNLVGIIKRMVTDKGEEYYVSINLDPFSNTWIVSEGNQCYNINGPFMHKGGLELLLFYSAINNNIGL